MFLTETISEIIADVVDFFPQNMKMPRVSSDNAATIADRYLLEALKHPTTNTHFATINNTHHTALIYLVELFNVIPKVTEQQSTNRHNRKRCEVEK